MFNKKIILPLMIILILALGLTACNTDNVVKDPVADKPSVEEQNSDKDNSKVDIIEEDELTRITPMAAFDIYVDKYPTTKVRKIELDSDRGEYYYKIKGYENDIEYELKLDPINGNIIKEENEKETDLDKDGEITKANVEKIEDFVDKLLKQSGDGSVLDEWTLKAKNGRSMLTIEIDLPDGNDLEHTYDIETGELVERDD